MLLLCLWNLSEYVDIYFKLAYATHMNSGVVLMKFHRYFTGEKRRTNGSPSLPG